MTHLNIGRRKSWDPSCVEGLAKVSSEAFGAGSAIIVKYTEGS